MIAAVPGSPWMSRANDDTYVTFWLTDFRVTETLFALRTAVAEAARPVEYASWSSMITTFFAFSLLTMKSPSERPCVLSLPTTREKVGYLPCVSVTFVADEETYAKVFRLK